MPYVDSWLHESLLPQGMGLEIREGKNCGGMAYAPNWWQHALKKVTTCNWLQVILDIPLDQAVLLINDGMTNTAVLDSYHRLRH